MGPLKKVCEVVDNIISTLYGKEKLLPILTLVVILLATAILYTTYSSHKEEVERGAMVAGKKVLLVVFNEFQPLEYYPIKEKLSSAGIEVKVLGVSRAPADMSGRPIDRVDYYIGEVDVEKLADEYDAVVLIGGAGVYKRVTGMVEEPNMGKVFELVRAFYDKGKVVGAICASPAVLAKAGLLKGKKATVWSSFTDKTLIGILKENGAEYVDKDVVVDGKIVTANGPGAAEKFAEKIIEVLAG